MKKYSINNLSGEFEPEKPGLIKYTIQDPTGAALRAPDFALVHEKLMHTIIVKQDLTDFQHVHPRINDEGVFELDGFVFPRPGVYRLFADFSPQAAGHAGHHASVVLHHDIQVGPAGESQPPSIPLSTTYRGQGYDVAMVLTASGSAHTMTFQITRHGRPVTNLENYLGALGHLVVLSQDGLEYLHAHPGSDAEATQTGQIDFMVHFTKPGLHKAFMQFQHEGEVITSSFGFKA